MSFAWCYHSPWQKYHLSSELLLISGIEEFTLLESQTLWALALEDHWAMFVASSFTALLKLGLFPGKFLSWNAHIAMMVNHKPAWSVSLPWNCAVKWVNKVLIRLKFHGFPGSWILRHCVYGTWSWVLCTLPSVQHISAHSYTRIKNKGALQLQTHITLLLLLWR